jgi:hypothetical protein
LIFHFSGEINQEISFKMVVFPLPDGQQIKKTHFSILNEKFFIIFE